MLSLKYVISVLESVSTPKIQSYSLFHFWAPVPCLTDVFKSLHHFHFFENFIFKNFIFNCTREKVIKAQAKLKFEKSY